MKSLELVSSNLRNNYELECSIVKLPTHWRSLIDLLKIKATQTRPEFVFTVTIDLIPENLGINIDLIF